MVLSINDILPPSFFNPFEIHLSGCSSPVFRATWDARNCGEKSLKACGTLPWLANHFWLETLWGIRKMLHWGWVKCWLLSKPILTGTLTASLTFWIILDKALWTFSWKANMNTSAWQVVQIMWRLTNHAFHHAIMINHNLVEPIPTAAPSISTVKSGLNILNPKANSISFRNNI